MGFSVLDVLYQLDLSLSLLEILFAYTVKMSPKERFSLLAHTSFLQFVTSFPNSIKEWVKGYVLVFSPGVIQ